MRQARDSVTYYKFEGKFPENLTSLLNKNGLYYKIFGKHRKLYVGNEELRDRLVGSYSESADKSLIGFLFLTSLTLISAPFIYLSVVSIKKWPSLSNFHFQYFDNVIYLISLNMVFIVLSVMLLMFGHWKNFTKLRTGDAISNQTSNNINLNDAKEQKPGSKSFADYLSSVILFIKEKWEKIELDIIADYLSLAILFILALYWICPWFNMGITTGFKAVMVIFFSLCLVLFVMSMKEKEKKIEENKNMYKALFEIKRSDCVSMMLITILAAYWIYLGFNTGITILKVVMLSLSVLSCFLILVCVKKVFFDSLNRIHKALIYKIEFSLFESDLFNKSN